MSGLALFKGKNQPQALVQAPSMDLIMSDWEANIPKSSEILPKLSTEELAKYQKGVDDLKLDNSVIKREKLLHLLSTKNFRAYNTLDVENFMSKQIAPALKILKLEKDLWWTWIDLDKYKNYLPSRILDNIKILLEEYGDEIRFYVSDIILVTRRTYYPYSNQGTYVESWEIIPIKHKTEICFLKISPFPDANPKEQIIIDAWRGPTFSDEEARI